MSRNRISWGSDPDLMKAGGVFGSLLWKHGPDSPEAAAAEVEVKAIRARLAIEDLINSAPAPTAEQLDRLRSLLGFTGNGSSAAVA